ncbi:MAG: S66 peptidase family protein [Thermodesulfobacteriota bacterium]
MRLKSGFQGRKEESCIGIPSVSGTVDKGLIYDGKSWLEEHGFKIKLADNIFDSQRYLSGTDFLRAENLKKLALDQEVDSLIFARGGFGVLRILEYIDFSDFKEFEKPVMGYSDNSILLNLFNMYCNIETFHGPNLSCIKKKGSKKVLNLLKGKIDKNISKSPNFIATGSAQGILRGGNLASIASLCGTDYSIDLDGCVFFIEDVNEPPYKIDRCLAQLKKAGMLKRVNAVIAGDFVNCGKKEVVFEIFKEYFQNIPIVHLSSFGHGEVNDPLVVGKTVYLSSEVNIVCYE